MMSAFAAARNGRTLQLLALTLAALLLAACAGGPDEARAPRPAKAAPEPTLEQIDALARDALPAERPRHQLDAVALLLRQNQPDQAQVRLQQIALPALDATQRARYRELQARLALARNDPQLALRHLQDPRLLQTLDQLPPQRQTALALVKAQALAAGRNHLASARERVFIDALLSGAEREQNQKDLWRSLLALDTATLAQARARAAGDTGAANEEWRGWLELALVHRRAQGDAAALAAGIAQWQQQWRAHPARALLQQREAPGTVAAALPAAPQQIALLLPLSGKLAGFGAAVRDGFMAAWYDARARHAAAPPVRIYDTAATADFDALYRRALADGAQVVIGPLEKAQVAALYRQAPPVPTLALNRADPGGAPPPLLYQFSLAPEDEAEDIARIAAQHGARRALIVAPEDERNARELQAFSARWRQQGGDIVATALFRNAQNLSQSIKSALAIPQSEARKRELEGLFGRRLEFAPHRRGDIDMVLVLARPQQARSIVPTLAYHYAGDIPAYASSRSYGGADNPEDADLEGLRFVDMPWLLDPQQPLRQQILAGMPQSRNYLRLYALGVDSFALYPQLRQLEAHPENRVGGQTGQLALAPERIVVRELMLAQFRDGVARPYRGDTNQPAPPDGGTGDGRERPIDATTIPAAPGRD